MRDIFYNQTHKIDSKEWLFSLNESELAEWNWIQSNIEKVNKLTDEFGLNEYYYLGRVLYALSFTGSVTIGVFTFSFPICSLVLKSVSI